MGHVVCSAHPSPCTQWSAGDMVGTMSSSNNQFLALGTSGMPVKVAIMSATLAAATSTLEVRFAARYGLAVAIPAGTGPTSPPLPDLIISVGSTGTARANALGSTAGGLTHDGMGALSDLLVIHLGSEATVQAGKAHTHKHTNTMVCMQRMLLMQAGS